MAFRIIICLAMFLVFIWYKEFCSPKLNIKLKKKKITKFLPNTIEYFFILIAIPLSVALLNPVINRDKILKDKDFQQKMLSLVNEKNVNLENYKKRIAELHKQEFKSSSDDAKEWATNFLATLNIRRDKIKQLEEEKLLEQKKELIKLPILFEYILQEFDTIASAFESKATNTEFKKVDNYDLMVDKEISDKKFILVRKLTFENGNFIELILEQGTLEKSSIQSYPSISCRETTKNLKKPSISFGINKKVPGMKIISGRPLIFDIDYSLADHEFFAEGFKNSISSAFQKAIETVYLR